MVITLSKTKDEKDLYWHYQQKYYERNFLFLCHIILFYEIPLIQKTPAAKIPVNAPITSPKFLLELFIETYQNEIDNSETNIYFYTQTTFIPFYSKVIAIGYYCKKNFR